MAMSHKACWLAWACLACVAGAADPGQKKAGDAVQGEPMVLLRMGGCGGAYFLAEAGELVVLIEKRDRHLDSRRTDLRAILVGPDREVLDEAVLQDDGLAKGSGLGEPQRARLTAHVEAKGVYALNVTVSQDRYGEEILWGFWTNCERYLIETARGHKDEPHTEPIILENPGVPADVCFLPREAKFAIQVTGLPEDAKQIDLFDSKDVLVKGIAVSETGSAEAEIPADVPRDHVPWRLHLPSQQATIHIDGLTRWEDAEPYEDLSLWSPSLSSFFAFHSYRWLLTPYRRLVYANPGQKTQVKFRVYNNGVEAQRISLEVEGQEGSQWRASLSEQSVSVQPKSGVEVIASVKAPKKPGQDGQSFHCRIRATPEKGDGFTTTSSLEVRLGQAPAALPLSLPLVLRPYVHENEQLGYLPDYPLDNQTYFDGENRPFIAAASGVYVVGDGDGSGGGTGRPGGRKTLPHPHPLPPEDGTARGSEREVSDEGGWQLRGFDEGMAETGWGLACTKVAFGEGREIYLLGRKGKDLGVLWSDDGGKTFRATVLPEDGSGSQAADIEEFTGHNQPASPPPVVRFILREKDPERIWRRINDLDLFLPEKGKDGLSPGEPIRLSRKCIGLASHSGIPSCVVSRGDQVHVVWAEATDPKEDVPGVPTYVATVTRSSRTASPPVLVGYGPPANDIHNTPSITMDSQGFLHVLVGTHGRTFLYARSLAPNTASEGFTEAEPLGEGLGQTYVGMVCDRDDALHVVFRLWQRECEPFLNSQFATLAHMRKRPGQPWEPPKILVVPPFSEYSVFYHRLTLDREGRLFLSYDYWSTYWFYRTDHLGSRRALMMSPDAGNTWRMASSEDLMGR